MKVRIVSDGTPAATKVYDENGVLLALPIKSISWKISVDELSEVMLMITAPVEIDAIGGIHKVEVGLNGNDQT